MFTCKECGSVLGEYETNELKYCLTCAHKRGERVSIEVDFSQDDDDEDYDYDYNPIHLSIEELEALEAEEEECQRRKAKLHLEEEQARIREERAREEETRVEKAWETEKYKVARGYYTTLAQTRGKTIKSISTGRRANKHNLVFTDGTALEINFDTVIEDSLRVHVREKGINFNEFNSLNVFDPSELVSVDKVSTRELVKAPRIGGDHV